MRALINTVILLLVLPPQFRAITISTNHDKGIDPPLEEPQELLVPEVGDNNTTQQLGSGERQRRLIPYMTFYLTRNFNRPQHQLHQQNQHDQPNQRYQPVPQKILVQAYQPTYQPKYIEPASVLYQPKIRYTPFLEANKVPGGFTPMRGPQPIRVQVLNPQKEPNYSTIFDKLLQLKQLQTTGHNIQPEYQPPKLSIAQYYTRTPRPATKFIVENYRPETRYKPTNPPTKTFIHTYTPANIDISSDNKIQNYENFESLKTYQIPAPVPESHENQNTDQKHYQIIAPNYQPQSERDNYQPVQQDYQQDQIQTYETNPDYRQNQNYKQIKTYQTIPSDYQPEKEVPQNSKEEQYEVTPKIYATPVKHYQPELQEYQNSNEYQPEKTGPINTYQTPQDHHDSNDYQPEKQVPIKTYQIPSDQQNSNEYQTEKQVSIKTYQTPSSQQQNPNEYQPEKQVPIKTYQTPQDYQQNPIEYQTEKQIPIKTYQTAQDEETYEIQYQTPEYQTTSRPKEKYTPIIVRPVYRPVAPKLYRPIYQKTPLAPVVRPPLENPNSLSVILKQLQDSNTLPRTLTPDNIDNSIKTLVHILNALKQTEKFQKPIIVTEHPGPEDEGDYEDEDDRPQTVSQSFPANTPEGGTPGKPGIDYPAYSIIPQTTFNCKEQRYKGFFGDPDTSCQVWHYCDLNGGQASFLCPNGTIFSQVALTCDWWYNVKCATTTQLYVLNERLYKYILPFTPKFPEDYSGPLVDRYLALKFQEMEEKMKKQKKGKTEKTNDSDDVVPDSDGNKLETIETETESSEQQRYEHTTHSSQEVVE